jgi:hypothetical protein
LEGTPELDQQDFLVDQRWGMKERETPKTLLDFRRISKVSSNSPGFQNQ